MDIKSRVNSFWQSLTINSWKITFGNQFINKAEPNDECTKATKLQLGIALNEIRTDNYSSNINDVRGDKVAGAAGDYTENTAWFSFVPLCKNDKITIENSDQTGAQTAIRLDCIPNTSSISRQMLSAIPGGQTYTFPVTTYTPSQTYYLVVDGQDANFVYLKRYFGKRYRWLFS